MKNVWIGCSFAFPIGILGLASFWISLLVQDAYGDGPPFYGCTTNMDKWESPMPMVLIIATVAIVMAGASFWLFRRAAKHATQQ